MRQWGGSRGMLGFLLLLSYRIGSWMERQSFTFSSCLSACCRSCRSRGACSALQLAMLAPSVRSRATISFKGASVTTHLLLTFLLLETANTPANIFRKATFRLHPIQHITLFPYNPISYTILYLHTFFHLFE